MIESPPKFKLQSKHFELFNNKDVEELIKSINYDYLYWDKVKYKTTSFSSEDLWAAVKLSRALKNSIKSFKHYTFSYHATEYIQEMLHYFDMNIGGSMSTTGFIPEQEKSRYLISSIMEEAISSSKIEGANTTRKKAKEMLRREEKPRNRSDQMIVNSYETINYITKNHDDELTPERLLYIHQLIANSTLDKKEEEGAFRRNNNVFVINTSTGETVYTPPDYIEIPELIDSVCRFFNKDETFIHPILKGIIIHFMIAWIHPFSDGNGRAARSLFYWYLLKKGYWLIEYMSISKIIQGSKNQYEKAYLYTEQDDNDLNYFITYNLKAMKKAFDTLKSYIAKQQKESNLTAKFIRIPQVNERQAFLLKKIYDEPGIVFTVKEVENRFLISNFTARTDLIELVKMGFLSEIQVNKVKKNFVKSAGFDKLAAEYVE